MKQARCNRRSGLAFDIWKNLLDPPKRRTLQPDIDLPTKKSASRDDDLVTGDGFTSFGLDPGHFAVYRHTVMREWAC